MEIRDQMTATVRLTRQAAHRLNTFLSSLKTQPKNMNDALNLALSDLPVASFIDEIVTLQQDKKKSLIDISTRYRSVGLLKRSDYYFLVLMAKQAAWISKKQRVRPASIQAVLEMTLDLWDLCKDQDKDGHHERYMLGNIGGNNSDPASQALATYIPIFIERSKAHPYPNTLEFALRNPEVMLRDDLTGISDAVIHERLHKYFNVLHGMAVRCFFLETRQPFDQFEEHEYLRKASTHSEERGYFKQNFSGNFGSEGMLHFIHEQQKNFSFMLTFKHIDLAANNIVESEEFFDAFTPLDQPNHTYRGEHFTLIHTDEESYFKGGFIFQTHMLRTSITREEYDAASHAITKMLADERIQAALRETYERFGTI
jgi:hypothetical protein